MIMIIIIIIILVWKFFPIALAYSFHWSLFNNKFTQVITTLLCILADLNNAFVCIVFTRPLFSNPPVPVPVL